MSIDTTNAAERYMENCADDPSMPDQGTVWGWVLDSALEDERCTNEDGDWLPGMPESLEDDSTILGKECLEAFEEAIGYCVESIEELKSFTTIEDYYGVSRYD